MIASKSNSPNCVLILLKIGGIEPKLKNFEKETAFQVSFFKIFLLNQDDEFKKKASKLQIIKESKGNYKSGH